jgi:two-component system, chemotaxis family, chemotaxis protein CheY
VEVLFHVLPRHEWHFAHRQGGDDWQFCIVLLTRWQCLSLIKVKGLTTLKLRVVWRGVSGVIIDIWSRDKMTLDTSMPILVVDDYQTMVRIIRNLLKQLGFEDVDEAADGSAALSKLKQKRYGLVISDWNMAPMTGYELLRNVRGDEGLRALPFIMVTAESKTENVIAAKKAGVNNYIVKPFNAQTLKSKIEAVCGA